MLAAVERKEDKICDKWGRCLSSSNPFKKVPALAVALYPGTLITAVNAISKLTTGRNVDEHGAAKDRTKARVKTASTVESWVENEQSPDNQQSAGQWLL